MELIIALLVGAIVSAVDITYMKKKTVSRSEVEELWKGQSEESDLQQALKECRLQNKAIEESVRKLQASVKRYDQYDFDAMVRALQELYGRLPDMEKNESSVSKEELAELMNRLEQLEKLQMSVSGQTGKTAPEKELPMQSQMRSQIQGMGTRLSSAEEQLGRLVRYVQSIPANPQALIQQELDHLVKNYQMDQVLPAVQRMRQELDIFQQQMNAMQQQMNTMLGQIQQLSVGVQQIEAGQDSGQETAKTASAARQPVRSEQPSPVKPVAEKQSSVKRQPAASETEAVEIDEEYIQGLVDRMKPLQDILLKRDYQALGEILNGILEEDDYDDLEDVMAQVHAGIEKHVVGSFSKVRKEERSLLETYILAAGYRPVPVSVGDLAKQNASFFSQIFPESCDRKELTGTIKEIYRIPYRLVYNDAGDEEQMILKGQCCAYR